MLEGRIVIISGMSGAGKSITLKTLEDLGYEAIDNIPLSILHLITNQPLKNINLAIGIDIRNRDFSFENLFIEISTLKKSFKVTLLFLDCDDEILIRRFTETRRRHPVNKESLVSSGIKHERDLLNLVRKHADLVVDTSSLSSLNLKKYIKANFSLKLQIFTLAILSFAFRNGLPKEADLVFDVRFLSNPFYDEKLKNLNGTDPQVAEYIAADSNYKDFFHNLLNFITPLLPLYQQEGKNYFTIAIGCTGGQHRSVFVANELAKTLQKKKYKVESYHRDL